MKYRSNPLFVQWVVSSVLFLTIGSGALVTLGDWKRSRDSHTLTVDNTSVESSFRRRVHQAIRNGEKEVNNRPKTREELLEVIKTLKDSGMYFEGDIPEGGPEEEAYSKLIYQRLTNGEGAVRGSLAAGNLRIYAVQAPEKWDYRTNEVDRYLDDFTGLEWIALFRDVLKCPMGTETKGANQGFFSEDRPYQLRFQEAIPDYPLLARIWNTFEDVTYGPKEIPKLRDECLRVSSMTANEDALMGLNKLLNACDDAITNHLGMYLSCD
jgi:hypothetical protein